ncbi:MFS transporter [Nocardia fluminea]|uniref:MFS transporter n=1 Tax=Nocardia fluminea TaxID=134984 RepID=UPI0033F11C22
MFSHTLSDDAEPRSGIHGEPSRPGWTWRYAVSLATIVLVLELLAISPLMVSIAMPAIETHFDTDGGGWVMMSFVLVGAATAPLIGKLADLHGKRRMLLICIVLSAFGSILSAIATGIAMLIVGRGVSGLLVACLFLSYSLIRDVFPPRTIALAVSIVTTMIGLATIVTPFLTEWLLDAYGFRGVFWFSSIVLGVLAVAVALTTAESSVRLHARVHGVGAVVLGAGVASGLIGVSRGPAHGWSAASTLAFLGAGAALVIIWSTTATATEDALIDMRVWRRHPVILTAAAAGFGCAVAGLFTMLLPMLTMVPAMLGLGYGFGVDAKGVNVFQAPLGVMTVVGGLIVGGLVGRGAVKPRLTAVVGMAVVTVGCALTAYYHHSEPGLMVLAGLVGLGVGLTYASTPNLLIAAVPPQLQATAAALIGVFQAVVPAVVPIVVFAVMNGSHAAELPPLITKMLNGAVVYTDSGFTVGFLIAAALAFLGLVTTLLLPRTIEQISVDSIFADGRIQGKVN